ncbi:MAG: 16S rRNA (cytosine(967)-C(5))-methyltransferase RsmB [Chitinispirillaceae bacterium]
MNTRWIVLNILSDFDKNPGDLERLTDRAINKRIEHRDRRFIFELVFGIVRNRTYIDYCINKFLTGEKKLDTLRRILQIGVYQILFMDRVPDHAAVNESVKLAKQNRKSAGASGVVNAVLRNIIKNKHKITLPDSQKDLLERLSVEFSHPRWMIQRWLKNFGLAKTKKILSFNNQRPSIFLRRRIRNISRQQFESDVRTICEPAGGYLNLFYKMKKPLDPENIRLLQHGYCTVQAPSSGWVVAIMDVKKSDHILDICSAPGGKTTLMAEIAGDTGTVVACDFKLARLQKVVQTTQLMNLGNVYSLVCDGANPPFTGHFDKLLLDAPCSGTGVLNRHPDGRWVRTPEDIGQILQVQRKLLSSAADLIGPDGILVYSTCSLEPEENEKQIEWFLKEYPQFRVDQSPEVIPGKFIDNDGFLRITPFEHNMDGMFGVRLIKTS